MRNEMALHLVLLGLLAFSVLSAAQPLLGTWSCFGGDGNRTHLGSAPANVTTDGRVAWTLYSRMLNMPAVGLCATIFVYTFTGAINNHTSESLLAISGSDASELWDLSLPIPPGWEVSTSAAVAADGSVLIAASTSNTGKLFNISSKGAVQWSAELPFNSCNTSSSPYVTWPVIGPQGLTLVQASTSCQSLGHGFVAVDNAGVIVWAYVAKLSYGAVISMSFSGNGSLVFAMEYSQLDGYPTLMVLDAGTGNVLLTKAVGSSVVPSPFSIRPDGTLVFSWYNSGSSGVTAFTETGKILWEADEFFDSISNVAVDHEGNVIAATGTSLVKLAASDGSELWKTPLGSEVLAPAIGGDGLIYAAAGKVMYALDGKYGNMKWQSSQVTQAGAPVLDSAGRVLSAAQNNGLTVYAAVPRQVTK